MYICSPKKCNYFCVCYFHVLFLTRYWKLPRSFISIDYRYLINKSPTFLTIVCFDRYTLTLSALRTYRKALSNRVTNSTTSWDALLHCRCPRCQPVEHGPLTQQGIPGCRGVNVTIVIRGSMSANLKTSLFCCPNHTQC